MAITRNETQITWSSSESLTVNANSRFDSDAVSFNAADFAATISVSADNAGTPATGDIVDVYIKYTNGDLLGDTGDDYDTDEHAILLGRINTFATDTPGEDPARVTFEIPVWAKGFKLSVNGNANASTRNITVRARMHTMRG